MLNCIFEFVGLLIKYIIDGRCTDRGYTTHVGYVYFYPDGLVEITARGYKVVLKGCKAWIYNKNMTIELSPGLSRALCNAVEQAAKECERYLAKQGVAPPILQGGTDEPKV